MQAAGPPTAAAEPLEPMVEALQDSGCYVVSYYSHILRAYYAPNQTPKAHLRVGHLRLPSSRPAAQRRGLCQPWR